MTNRDCFAFAVMISTVILYFWTRMSFIAVMAGLELAVYLAAPRDNIKKNKNEEGG